MNKKEITQDARITFRVTRDFLKTLKSFCVEHDMTMKDYITNLIEEDMAKIKNK